MSSKNKRVLIFSIAYYPLVGGAEVAVKEVTTRLSDIEFDMVTLRFDRSHKSEEKFGNVNIYRVGGPKHLFPLTALLKAWSLNRTRNYTHVWSIMANWAGFAGLFFKTLNKRVKFILTLQEGDSLSSIKMKVLLVYPIFKKIFIRADVVQAISNYLADWARSMGRRGGVEVVPNGVDVSKFSGETAEIEDNVILITTSRLVKKNGVGDIIDALKLLPERVKLKVIGSGPLDKSLKLKARSLGLESRVKFLGHMEHGEMVGHLRASHIFVRPSLSEGMGNSFIEAMAVGLPVIATPVGGIPDFLSDPDKSPERHPTGLFVPPQDPKAIARQVERLMKSDRLRETLVTNGKRLAKDKYDWDLIAGEMRSKVFNI